MLRLSFNSCWVSLLCLHQVQQNIELERELALQLRTALLPAVQLTTFPNSTVDVTCMILESGGSELALAICAASLALADAGIQLFDLVSACGVVRALASWQDHPQLLRATM